jgi:hypothetical protein
MVGLKLFGSKQKVDVEEYKELDLGEYEDVLEEKPEMYVKIAELTSLSELPDLKRDIYDGNIMIIDVSSVRKDKTVFDRAVKDLKQVTSDVNGDIVGLGDDRLIVTPTGVKVDRIKIGGNY